MRFRNPFQKESLSPAWEYRAEGLLWHVRLANRGIVIGEERLPDKKQALFFGIRQDNGTVLWKRGLADSPWWIGVEAVHGDLLLLHGFASPDMPQHKGIFALDLSTGEDRWSRPDARLVRADGEHILAVVAQHEGDRLVCLNPADGTTAEGTAVSSVAAEANEEPPQFPVPLDMLAAEQPDAGAHAARLLKRLAPSEPALGLRHGKYLVLHFHEQTGRAETGLPLLNSVMQVVSMQSADPVLRILLDTNVNVRNPEAFFVQYGTLYCICERRTLVAVPLQ